MFVENSQLFFFFSGQLVYVCFVSVCWLNLWTLNYFILYIHSPVTYDVLSSEQIYFIVAEQR